MYWDSFPVVHLNQILGCLWPEKELLGMYLKPSWAPSSGHFVARFIQRHY